MNAQRLLERFVRYVKVDTTACEGAAAYPSSPGQLELGKLLAGELRELGLRDVTQSPQGIVTATIPATVPRAAPAIAFFAHLDTSPETTGKGVQPQVIRDYDGRDLVLPADRSRQITVAENPELAELRGKILITTDGTTLLGADNKAGIAAIMSAAEFLMAHPDTPRGDVRICFTCDEEIGHGVDHVDLAALGAVVGYTLDGYASNQIDVETFSADLATITVRGKNIHPSIGKGRMINAVRVAAAFVDRLPRETLSPESSDGRQGFLHPYHVDGGVAEVSLRVLLRDFDTPQLAVQADLLRRTAAEVEARFPGSAIDLSIRPQYRNMADGLAQDPRAVAYAEQALRNLGRQPHLTIIRGGTDGSRLTELGLPTPNLSTGEHNPHSPLEWTCLEEIVEAAEWIVALCQVWAKG